jgi:hypothetical protein
MTYRDTTFSETQMVAIRSALHEYGNLAHAARAAGVSLTRLRASISRNQDLSEEVSDCMETHAANLYAVALERATAGGSDMLLKTLLEAKGPAEFSKAYKPVDSNKPTALRLRTFDAAGEENPPAEDVEIKPRPTQTLAITMQRSL